MKDLYEKLVEKTAELHRAAVAVDMKNFHKLLDLCKGIAAEVERRKTRLARVYTRTHTVEQCKGEETTRQIIANNAAISSILEKWFEVECCRDEKCKHPLHPYEHLEQK